MRILPFGNRCAKRSKDSTRGTLAALRIDLVGTTADFRRFGPRRALPFNDLPDENSGTAGRIGEVRLGTGQDQARRGGSWLEPERRATAWRPELTHIRRQGLLR